MERELLVYVDGKFLEQSRATVSVFDHGLLYGDGVFEGVRAYNGIVFRLEDHIQRLYDSAKYIQLSVPLTAEELSGAVVQTLRKNHLKDAYIRVVVTRGSGDLGIDPSLCKEPTVFIVAEPMPSILGAKEPKVITTVIASLRRDNVDATSHEVKSLNYLNSVMAKIEANNAGAGDAIILDSRGFVSEAVGTNIFIVKDNLILTPPFSAGILHGITRARMIRLCQDLGFEVTERDITPFELVTADEAFLVGTKAELVSIGSVNGKKLGHGKAGPVARRLLQEFARVVQRREEGTPAYVTESVRI